VCKGKILETSYMIACNIPILMLILCSVLFELLRDKEVL
jgi:hypothetical protein